MIATFVYYKMGSNKAWQKEQIAFGRSKRHEEEMAELSGISHSTMKCVLDSGKKYSTHWINM